MLRKLLKGGRMFASSRRSEPYREGRALAQRTGDIEPAAMAVEDVLDDGKPEARSAQFARAGIVDPVETLGQARQVFARDAVALIGDRDPQHPCRRAGIAAGRHRDGAVVSGVLDRVVEQVLK